MAAPPRVAGVGVINREKSRALAAFTAAALSLPGLKALAATVADQAEGNTEFGYYQESGHRMQVEIYHADGLIPLTDRVELSFSLDRDTYSGASPAYSLPSTMTDQLLGGSARNNARRNGLPVTADIVSAASIVSAGTLMGNYPDSASSLPNFQSFKLGELAAQHAGATGDDVVLAGIRRALDSLTPTGTQIVQRFQNQPLETRSQPVLGVKYYTDNATVGISGGLSDEPDYLSNFGAINFSHDFNDKNTTLSAGYSVTRNAIFRNQGMSMSPPGTGLGMVMPTDCTLPSDDCKPASHLNANSLFNAFNLGLTQILSKNTLLNLSTSYTHQSGFLNNAYKTVYVRGLVTPAQYLQMYNVANNVPGATPINWAGLAPLEIMGIDLFRENRPNNRNQFTFSSGLNQYLPVLDAALHFDYNFYHDDWNINSHTFEFKWFQPLPFGITATPDIRYYTQSKADFFAPYFLAPRPDNHYSSDYRLSGFGSVNAGITFSKQITKAIKLDAGVEYYQHASALKLGGGGSGSYADFSYYLAHAGVNVDLSAPGSLFEGDGNVLDSLFGDNQAEHHHHHHKHTPLPAGVMFGHMLEESGQIMLGYRYMYSGQGGTMLHGDQSVGDAVLAHGASIPTNLPAGVTPTPQQQASLAASLSDACPGYGQSNGVGTYTDFGCLVKPTSMTMGMHMFDIMVAPTSWLNFMLMPQLVDMTMNMSDDLRKPNGQGDSMNQMANSTDNEVMYPNDKQSMFSRMHHTVFDLGDTIFMSMVKLYQDDNHHLHLGLGGSAPTGSVSEVHYQVSTVSKGGQSMTGPYYPVNIKVLQDFGMQAGSGTWDFKPNLTYTGQMDAVFWGSQLSAVKRLQNQNKSGYALGDTYQATAWGGYKVFDWLAATVRGVYTQQNKVRGNLYQVIASEIENHSNPNQMSHDTTSTVDYPQNTGGHYWDVGIGMNITVPGGTFAGHNLNIEWLQPVQDVVNGYQLQRTGAFSASWSYMF